MAGAQFEYDEHGGNFFYFFVSAYACILIPFTYYFLWPRKTKTDVSKDTRRCNCDGCDAKNVKLRSTKPWFAVKKWVIRFLLLLGWVGFFFLLYRVSHLESDHVDYDPYAILSVDRGASVEEIKKKYRKLSLLHHPDRGGDEKTFVGITKAYQALTNDESRENWEKYGNPDGPGAMEFGIALPKWLVSKEYGLLVLAAYGFVFMIVLPVGVGYWWYNSIKYSADQVLIETSRLFGAMVHKTPNMILKRALMVLSASFEFCKFFNKAVVERPTDDREVPVLWKDLPNVGEKGKERPFSTPYSIKARTLLHAHLSRIPLPPDTLDQDRRFYLVKCPFLIQEMITIYCQMVMFARAGRIPRMPSVETMENMMRMMPMLVQATWDSRSPLFQLPHFTDDLLRYCVNKRRRVKTCQDLAALDEQEFNSLFRDHMGSHVADIRAVLAMMPRVTMQVRLEVQGEDDKHSITAGAIVTAHVKLHRSALTAADAKQSASVDSAVSTAAADDDEPNDDAEAETDDTATVDANPAKAPVKQRKPWEKQQKKKKGAKAAPSKAKKKAPPVKKTQPALEEPPAEASGEQSTPKSEREKKKAAKASKSGKGGGDGDDDDAASASHSEADGSDSEEEDAVIDALDEQRRPETEDEDNVDFDDELIKKNMALESKSKITHVVHCPHYPEEKYEWWWVYVCDRKTRSLLSDPARVTTLVDTEEVELRFAAPPKVGIYQYQVCLRSDSYVDVDVTKDIKLDVQEAKQVTSHPQWDFHTDDEEEKSDAAAASDESDYTEGDDDDDDDD